jgi:hypothetical protein
MFTEDIKNSSIIPSVWVSAQKVLQTLFLSAYGKLYEKVVQTSRVCVVQKVINSHQQNVHKRK